MNDELINFRVTNKESFIKFIELLRKEFQTSNWENNNLDDYLEAISQYTDDLEGYYNNAQQPIDYDIPGWKAFADILIGASMYE